jgi:iron(III) transport system permease protein
LWVRLWQTRLPFLFSNTLKLLIAVGATTLLLGVSLAWIMARYDFPGKKIWKWIVILPFAIPGYVFAYAYATIMAPGGLFYEFWTFMGGDIRSMPSLYSFWGVVAVLSLVTYPYVYLLSYATLLKTNVHFEETALVAGISRTETALSITLPMIRPAIIAGLALALMEVLADYGTVALLRYPTFTEAIVRQMQARFDPYGAAAIGAVLIVLTISLLLVERFFRGRKEYVHIKGQYKTYNPKKLGKKASALINGLLLSVSTMAFFAPVIVLIVLSLTATYSPDFWRFAFNTLSVSAIGATIAVIVVLPIAYLHIRRKSLITMASSYAVIIGYSLPGPVVAVGLILLVTAFAPGLFGGFIVLIFAYLVRFTPIALQSQESAIQQVSVSLEDASRTLGMTTYQTIKKIILPLIKPALLTAWILTFVDIIKELPATILLRPLAFDTLAIRVWMMASEELWELAALPALLIVLAGLSPIVYIANIMEKGVRDGV